VGHGRGQLAYSRHLFRLKEVFPGLQQVGIQPFDPEHDHDLGQQLLMIERLQDIIVDPFLQALDLPFLGVHPRDHDDRNIGQGFVLPDPEAYLHAGAVAHFFIQDDQVRVTLVNRVEGLFPAGEQRHLMPGVFQDDLIQTQNVGVIVYAID